MSTTGSSGSSNDADGSTTWGAAVQINNGATLKTRYEFNVNSDIGILSTRDQSGSAQHNIAFNVTSPVSYQLSVAQQFKGDMNRISDAAGCDGSANISGVTGSQTGGTLASGSLSVVDPGSLGNGGSTISIPFDVGATATISGTS